MHRRLVSCGLVDPDTMSIKASDGTVWLHRVERDAQGKPVPEQIDRWLNLIWAPPGMDEVLTDDLGPQATVVIPGMENQS